MRISYAFSLVFASFMAVSIVSCRDGNVNKKQEEVKLENTYKTVEVATFDVDESSIGKVIGTRSMGSARSGEILSDKFALHNIGDKVLVILEARSNCGCLTLDYTKSPIQKDEKRVLNYTYNSSGKSGEQLSEVTITTNLGRYLVLVDLNVN